tara:strand:- start:876 stop:1307 length:432 start_codon:yes stop_codon:yes gene_type:complete
MKTVNTFKADIYVGLRPAYNPSAVCWGTRRSIATRICQKYCDKVGLGLTITDTEFIYTEGNEHGLIVGLINYPRFPSIPYEVIEHAENIARKLLKELEQERVSIVTSDKTYMIEKDTELVVSLELCTDPVKKPTVGEIPRIDM